MSVDFEQLIIDAAPSSIDELTPERILGISAERADELRRLNSGPASTISRRPAIEVAELQSCVQRGLSHQITPAWNAFMYPSSGSTRTVNLIIGSVDRAAVAYALKLAVIQQVGPTDVVAVSEGVLAVYLPPLDGLSPFRLDGSNWQMADRTSSGQAISIDGTVVGHMADDVVYLHLHPWAGEQGQLTASGSRSREQMFSRLIGLAASLISEQQHPESVEDPDAEHAEAVAVLDMVPEFFRVLQGSQRDRGAELRQAISACRDELAQLRSQMTEHLRCRHGFAQSERALSETAGDRARGAALSRELSTLREQAEDAEQAANVVRGQISEALSRKLAHETEMEELHVGGQMLSVEHLRRSLAEIGRIRANRCVRDCRLISRHRHAYLQVHLHPLVIEHDFERYMFDQLRFGLQLDSRAMTPSWDPPDGVVNIHPHVSGTETTCWGEAESPIREAIDRREFSTVVRLIAGWASMYNPDSPYVEIDNFPETSLSPGYHPELVG